MAATTSTTGTTGAPGAGPDAAASPGPAQGGGSRKVSLSTDRDQEGATRPAEALRTEDGNALERKRQPPQPERPAERGDSRPGAGGGRAASPTVERDAAAVPAEVGRVSGVERDRGQARSEDLNDRDPLRAWQARMVELRDRRADGFVQDGSKYLYRGQLAFVDEGKSIRAYDASPRAAQAIVDLAESKRWSELRVDGSVDFQRAVWMEARARGMEVRAAEFQPTKLDREQAEQRAAEYRERFGLRVPAQIAARTDGVSVEAPRREADRGEAPAPTRTGARLVEFGTAPYEFKRGADPSFFVKTERDSGEQRVVWGKDLERALRRADAQVGDRIRLEREAGERVTVTATESRDGAPVARNFSAERGVWRVDVVERSAREVAQTPAQATVERVLREGGAAQGVIDRALRTAAEREATLAAQGRVVEVRGVDPQAPRTTPVPTVQVQEQSAPTRAR